MRAEAKNHILDFFHRGKDFHSGGEVSVADVGERIIEVGALRNEEMFEKALEESEVLDIVEDLVLNKNKTVSAKWTYGKIILGIAVTTAALGTGVYLFERHKNKKGIEVMKKTKIKQNEK